nr:helix-turn-helix domain-containing protein [uncultured Carboxylicivirga sp.]
MEEIKIELLTKLGFNNLEAEVYIHLLLNEPMTAYKVGKGINKPTANVYKAIESLSQKGAVLIEENKNKTCKVVSPDEFLNHYEKNLLLQTQKTREALSNIEKKSIDEKIYSIESASLVFERFASMMKKCEKIAVIDAFPNALEKITPFIIDAINRGVEVYIEAYKPVDIEGADIAYAEISENAINYWNREQLNLTIDGQEYMVALMSKSLDKVIHANWSNNIYMSVIIHGGRMYEQTIIKLLSLIDKDNFEDEAKKLLSNQKYSFNSKIPGVDKLFNIND